MELLLDAFIDGLKDALLGIPILFIAYFLMELLERSEKYNEEVVRAFSGKAGPALGGLLGIIPQCGISGAAATLFSTGTITVGTMLAVFFATSDEMLPVLLSSMTGDADISAGKILLIVMSKAAIGIILGYTADVILRRYFAAQKDIHSFCEREHCSCDEEEGTALAAALKHTLKIAVMLVCVNIVLNLLLGFVGIERLTGTIFAMPIIGNLLLGLFGLIPNCSISVVLTRSYLSGLIGIGGLFSGLLTNAGIGLLVLFRTNRNRKENYMITIVLLGLGFIAGSIVTLVAG